MNSKQQKQYDTALDKMDLTEGQRDAFDHSVKRGLIDLDTYQDTDTFSLHGYKLNRVMDDIVLAQYVDLAEDGNSVIRNGIHIPLSQVQRTWRMARVILVGQSVRILSQVILFAFQMTRALRLIIYLLLVLTLLLEIVYF